jgi:outer membrane protein TolC
MINQLTGLGYLVARPGWAILCGFILCSCTTVGPSYQEPDVKWLSSWQPDLYGQLNNTSSQYQHELSFWWQLFDDESLNQLILEAYQENIDLQLAGLRV